MTAWGFWGYIFALVVVSLPAAAMEAQGQHKWAWRYALVIILSLVVMNTRGATRLSSFIQAAVRR